MTYNCGTCQDKGWHIPDDPLNLTLQEHEGCPDCDQEPKDLPLSNGLVT